MQYMNEGYNIELDEEFLSFVSGGIYTPEEWAAMSVEEKKQSTDDRHRD